MIFCARHKPHQFSDLTAECQRRDFDDASFLSRNVAKKELRALTKSEFFVMINPDKSQSMPSMPKAEARKMSPDDEMSGPESGERMRQAESGMEKAEAEKKSAGDRFLNDAAEYADLHAKAEAKRTEISQVEKKIPPGADPEQAKASLEKELRSLSGSMDKISKNYGAGAMEFRVEATMIGELNAEASRKNARLEEIEKGDPKKWPGGEKGYDMITEALKNEVARLMVEAHKLEQELKNNYDSKDEALKRVALKGIFEEGRAALRGITDAEIDKALEPLNDTEELTDADIVESRDMTMEERVAMKMKREDDEDRVARAGIDKEIDKLLGSMNEAGVVENAPAEEAEEETFATSAPTIERVKADFKKRTEKKRTEQEIEDAFMRRGEEISAAHEKGVELTPTRTESRRTPTEALNEMTAAQEQKMLESLPKVAALREQMDRVERTLESLGVTNVDGFMNERAVAGGMGKVKGFFGGLFDKKKRALNDWANLYQDLRDQYGAAEEEAAKNLPRSPEQQALKRLQAERGAKK
jgi:hypothetical protein